LRLGQLGEVLLPLLVAHDGHLVDLVVGGPGQAVASTAGDLMREDAPMTDAAPPVTDHVPDADHHPDERRARQEDR
jgi:hypothetical protein